MTKLITAIALLLMLNSCHNSVDKKLDTNQEVTVYSPARFYSKTVSDTFSIFVSLPADYDSQKSIRYPVIYLLDANLYFDIIAATLKKYSEVGMEITKGLTMRFRI